MTINDLIERLEKADGPDRELEVAICKAVYPQANIEQKMGGWYVEMAPPSPWQVVPNYTSSLDAALTLVPEGWTRAVDASAPELRIDVTLFPPNDGPDLVGTHSSEPIATCIAALKARSQS